MTEEIAATPGWVETELDEILAALPSARIRPCRDAYLECLARCRRPVDAEEGHDRCRARFLAALDEAGLDKERVAALEPRLKALESEISERT